MKNSKSMSIEEKASRMRWAFGKLAGQYIAEGQMAKSVAVQKAVTAIDPFNESLAKLYDILDQAADELPRG